MKRIISVISILLLVIYCILPLGLLIAWLTDYSFSLRNYVSAAAASAIISAAAIIFALVDKNKEITNLGRVLTLLLIPASIINWTCYILLGKWKFTVFCMGVCFACALVFMIKYARYTITRYLTSLICTLIFIPLCYVSFFDYIFDGFVCNTVWQTVYSPDGIHKAEVIYSDQGALGGDFYVDIYNVKSGINLYILKFSKKPQCVYSGKRGINTIYWKDNSTLLINGAEYSIN